MNPTRTPQKWGCQGVPKSFLFFLSPPSFPLIPLRQMVDCQYPKKTKTIKPNRSMYTILGCSRYYYQRGVFFFNKRTQNKKAKSYNKKGRTHLSPRVNNPLTLLRSSKTEGYTHSGQRSRTHTFFQFKTKVKKINSFNTKAQASVHESNTTRELGDHKTAHLHYTLLLPPFDAHTCVCLQLPARNQNSP